MRQRRGSLSKGKAHATVPPNGEAPRQPYGVRTAGTKPARGWPVFINLHGGGNNPQVNDQGWAASMAQYPGQQGLCVSPRSPVDTAGSWNHPTSIPALERLLVELPARWDIDPDRVYLMGFSMGGIGVLHLGPSLPDRWAAVAASSGFAYLGARGRAAPENLLNLPVMIQVGTADMAFQRYPLARVFAEAQATAATVLLEGEPGSLRDAPAALALVPAGRHPKLRVELEAALATYGAAEAK